MVIRNLSSKAGIGRGLARAPAHPAGRTPEPSAHRGVALSTHPDLDPLIGVTARVAGWKQIESDLVCIRIESFGCPV